MVYRLKLIYIEIGVSCDSADSASSVHAYFRAPNTRPLYITIYEHECSLIGVYTMYPYYPDLYDYARRDIYWRGDYPRRYPYPYRDCYRSPYRRDYRDPYCRW